jgi:perosamine synthetase
MHKTIPVAKPDITKKDAHAVAKTVATGWILQGPQVETFENLIARYISSPYALATSSATTAMHLGLLAAGIKPGDEIIVPSFSFIASANCIRHVGAIPVFADIDPRTYNIDPVDVERKITKKTRAILAVHQIGLAADMPRLSKIARTHKLLLFEDAACGLGSKIHGKHVGNWGMWAAFSFHPRKAITTAEGGMLTTKNKKLAHIVRMLRAHGADIDVKKRDTSTKVMTERYPLVGYNFRMSDIHAALGISQFDRIHEIMDKRYALAQRYNTAFKDHPCITVPFVPDGYHHTFQSYMIRVKSRNIRQPRLERGQSADRERIMQKLLDAGIATRRGVMASHLEKPYRAIYPKLSLPETERAAKETLILPLFSQMTKKEQNTVIRTLTNLL